MDLPELDDLPRAYRIGLRLRALGADDDLIGDCLGMDPAGVSTLIEIGRRKLASEKRPAKQIGLSDSDAEPLRSRLGSDRMTPATGAARNGGLTATVGCGNSVSATERPSVAIRTIDTSCDVWRRTRSPETRKRHRNPRLARERSNSDETGRRLCPRAVGRGRGRGLRPRVRVLRGGHHRRERSRRRALATRRRPRCVRQPTARNSRPTSTERFDSAVAVSTRTTGSSST